MGWGAGWLEWTEGEWLGWGCWEMSARMFWDWTDIAAGGY